MEAILEKKRAYQIRINQLENEVTGEIQKDIQDNMPLSVDFSVDDLDTKSLAHTLRSID